MNVVRRRAPLVAAFSWVAAGVRLDDDEALAGSAEDQADLPDVFGWMKKELDWFTAEDDCGCKGGCKKKKKTVTHEAHAEAEPAQHAEVVTTTAPPPAATHWIFVVDKAEAGKHVAPATEHTAPPAAAPPTVAPTVAPTAAPTVAPTAAPTVAPTAVPTPPPQPAQILTSWTKGAPGRTPVRVRTAVKAAESAAKELSIPAKAIAVKASAKTANSKAELPHPPAPGVKPTAEHASTAPKPAPATTDGHAKQVTAGPPAASTPPEAKSQPASTQQQHPPHAAAAAANAEAERQEAAAKMVLDDATKIAADPSADPPTRKNFQEVLDEGPSPSLLAEHATSDQLHQADAAFRRAQQVLRLTSQASSEARSLQEASAATLQKDLQNLEAAVNLDKVEAAKVAEKVQLEQNAERQMDVTKTTVGRAMDSLVQRTEDEEAALAALSTAKKLVGAAAAARARAEVKLHSAQEEAAKAGEAFQHASDQAGSAIGCKKRQDTEVTNLRAKEQVDKAKEAKTRQLLAKAEASRERAEHHLEKTEAAVEIVVSHSHDGGREVAVRKRVTAAAEPPKQQEMSKHGQASKNGKVAHHDAATAPPYPIVYEGREHEQASGLSQREAHEGDLNRRGRPHKAAPAHGHSLIDLSESRMQPGQLPKANGAPTKTQAKAELAAAAAARVKAQQDENAADAAVVLAKQAALAQTETNAKASLAEADSARLKAQQDEAAADAAVVLAKRAWAREAADVADTKAQEKRQAQPASALQQAPTPVKHANSEKAADKSREAAKPAESKNKEGVSKKAEDAKHKAPGEEQKAGQKPQSESQDGAAVSSAAAAASHAIADMDEALKKPANVAPAAAPVEAAGNVGDASSDDLLKASGPSMPAVTAMAGAGLDLPGFDKDLAAIQAQVTAPLPALGGSIEAPAIGGGPSFEASAIGSPSLAAPAIDLPGVGGSDNVVSDLQGAFARILDGSSASPVMPATEAQQMQARSQPGGVAARPAAGQLFEAHPQKQQAKLQKAQLPDSAVSAAELADRMNQMQRENERLPAAVALKPGVEAVGAPAGPEAITSGPFQEAPRLPLASMLQRKFDEWM
eukprot:TRINITY_DN9066_c0_g1_i2.p1 TRINITY_DN9066_c0_g1~~TRINITY_DN9066_c0_g1_i2.p1  ORF type:complete len:1085 (+),score=334.77 TRINITY_DN9066_c0_g1_i2:118-3372(+)